MVTFAKHGRRLLGMSLLILLSAATHVLSQETDVVEKDLRASGTSTPVSIKADHAATWEEKDDRVFLLQSNIRVEQGGTLITAKRGAVWIDMKRKASTGVYYINVYGEDGIELTANGETKRGPRGMFALTTTGAIDVKPTVSKLVEQNLTTDPVYTRAFEERGRILAAARQTVTASSPIQQAQGVDPNVPPPPPAANEVPPAPPFGQQPPFAAPPVPGQAAPGQAAPGVPAPTIPTVPGNVPPVPPPPFFGPAGTPPAGGIAPPPSPPRRFSIRPRTSEEIRVRNYVTANGETIYVVPSPVIIEIVDPKNKMGTIDIEADRMVFWTHGDGKQFFESMKKSDGETTQHIELYLAGNVEMRTRTKKEEEILRADELYYDVSRSVAIGTKADLEIRQPKLPYPIHMRAPEILQLNAKQYQAKGVELFSTVLPSNPGLKVYLREATLEEHDVPRKTIFGRQIVDPATGEPKVDRRRYFDGRNFLLYFEEVPVFWFPFLRGDIEDPLGPLENIGIGGSNIFGFTLQSSWDMYQLLGIDKVQGTRWRLYIDYFSARGPALGTEFRAKGKDLFGIPNEYNGFLKAWGIYDTGINGSQTDILGGDRGKFYFPPPAGTAIPYTHPDWRGRIQSRFTVQDLPDGFTLQGTLGLISDQNFIEQYYLNEWLTDYNQETTLYLKQQNDLWAWSVLVQPHLRSWITETAWLPKADAALINAKIFDDWVTWNIQGSAGYGQLRTPTVPSFAYLPTDVPLDAGRFDVRSDLSLPFTAGAFKVAPYLLGDIAYYTSNINGDGQARFLGGAGVRATIPFSRLFPDVQSDFFNVDSLYHKVIFGTNYLYARSSVSYSELPQMDRLNDDGSDQAMRDLQYRQIFINPSNAAFLTNFNGLVNPQTYAIRRLIDSRIDTMDSMNVFQFSLEQRLQTRRGLAASEHVVDWMNFNIGASLFPQPTRDNYGQHWGILEYDWNWNVGDRTAFYSNGWMEPVTGGPRVFNIGSVFNRPDGTSFGLAYRQIDPLESKAVVANVGYRFSQKYSISASTVWDFGVGTQTYGLGITRTGTDVQVTLGISYNSILQNFGLQFEIIPNIIRSQIRTSSAMGVGNNNLLGR